MLSFSIRLKALRTERNITQKELSDFLNLKDSRSIRAYETSVSEPSIENLIALADYFDVSIDYLVGATDNPKRN